MSEMRGNARPGFIVNQNGRGRYTFSSAFSSLREAEFDAVE
jgi:hypothetical protein